MLSCVPLFCDPMDCNPPGSSVHGISQARILDHQYSRILGHHFLLLGIVLTRDRTHVYSYLLHCRFFTAEPLWKPNRLLSPLEMKDLKVNRTPDVTWRSFYPFMFFSNKLFQTFIILFKDPVSFLISFSAFELVLLLSF